MADNDLYVGGGVYVYVPVAPPIDYWPVTGVTEPQHLWPFAQTGDYTDHGSTGGLNLTAGGTGNSFGVNGLVLNGSGYAQYSSQSSDLEDLGATFSLLFDMQEFTNTENAVFTGASKDPANYWMIVVENDSVEFYRYNSGWLSIISSASSVPHASRNQVIVTYAAGVLSFYVNGSFVNSGEITAISGSGTGNFTVGANGWGGSLITGTFRSVGVLKGTAWSIDDVANIYSGLS